MRLLTDCYKLMYFFEMAWVYEGIHFLFNLITSFLQLGTE